MRIEAVKTVAIKDATEPAAKKPKGLSKVEQKEGVGSCLSFVLLDAFTMCVCGHVYIHVCVSPSTIAFLYTFLYILCALKRSNSC